MTTDVYKAPESDVLTEDTETQEFYVVSPKKAVVLFVGTFGLYAVYWFYKHWAQFKQKHNDDLWAPMRGLFFIFFTHSLFEEFERGARAKIKDFTFSPAAMATFFVLMTLTERIAARFSPEDEFVPLIDLLGFIFMPLQAWIMLRAQRAANIACDAPNGEGNTQYTAANIIWLILGGALWLVVLAGFYAIAVGL